MSFPNRLPPPPLNVHPLGLLDFLQLKNGGQYPQSFQSVLMPTWDLADHYIETNALRPVVTQFVLSSGGNTYDIVTPENFFRFIPWLSIRVTLANAGDLLRGWLIDDNQDGFSYRSLPALSPVGSFSSLASYTRDYHIVANGIPSNPIGVIATVGPLWLPPRSYVRFATESTLGAGCNAAARYAIVNFRS